VAFEDYKVLKSHESLGDKAAHYLRTSVYFPKRRYNKNEYYCYAKRLTLPSSKATVKIICNDAGAMIRSLLNKNSKKDYLFHDDDPFAPPPPRNRVHSGHKFSYRETCEQRITNPDRQILLPVPMYADGCVPGAIFQSIPHQVSENYHRILNGKARDKRFFLARYRHYTPKSRRISREESVWCLNRVTVTDLWPTKTCLKKKVLGAIVVRY
jgi:hypothetical protein